MHKHVDECPRGKLIKIINENMEAPQRDQALKLIDESNETYESLGGKIAHALDVIGTIIYKLEGKDFDKVKPLLLRELSCSMRFIVREYDLDMEEEECSHGSE